MALRQISNPTGKMTVVFGVVTAIGLLAGVAGLVSSSDTGLAIGIVGLVVGVVCGITTPMLYSNGKKQVQEIEALIRGEGLLAHWTFDADEWNRYTENEYARGMKQTRQLGIWTFAVVFGMVFVGALFSGGITGLMIVLALVIGIGFTAILAGSSYLMTRSAYAANRAGAGEVFIGGTSVYLGNRFHTWKSRMATLEKVAFEPGDPCVVQFTYRYGSGDNGSHQEVRVPVPRGREEEAQQLVEQYYAAS